MIARNYPPCPFPAQLSGLEKFWLIYGDFFFVCWNTVQVCVNKIIMTVRLIPWWSLLCYRRIMYSSALQFSCKCLIVWKLWGWIRYQFLDYAPMQFLTFPLCNTIKYCSIQGNRAIIFKMRSCFSLQKTSSFMPEGCRKLGKYRIQHMAVGA